VLEWVPRSGRDTRYRVRVRSHGADGWLAADNLRTAPVPAPVPEPTAAFPAPVAEPRGRRFGQRHHTERPLAPAHLSPSAATARSADFGERRFGRINEPERPAPAGVPVPVQPTVVDNGGRRFGQYNAPEHRAAPESPKPLPPTVDSGRRRFGQH
jgi:hypothetical protein